MLYWVRSVRPVNLCPLSTSLIMIYIVRFVCVPDNFMHARNDLSTELKVAFGCWASRQIMKQIRCDSCRFGTLLCCHSKAIPESTAI